MSQTEKNESKRGAGEVFVDAMWSPYEAFVAQTQKQLEKSKDWQKSWSEAHKWSLNQRQKWDALLKDISEKRKGVLFKDSESLQRVAEKTEELTFTPLRFTTEMYDKMMQAVEERSEEITKAQRENVTLFWSLHDSLTAVLKTQQQAFFRLIDDSLRGSESA